MNFNGQSEDSEEFLFNACNKPSSFDAPSKLTSTPTTITVGWNRPVDDGGCPLIGYAVFRDDGNGGDLIQEVNSVNDVAVRNMPTLRKLLVSNFPANSGGKPFRFKVTAYNREGQTDSAISSYLLAGVPITPPTSPQLVGSETNITHVTVTLPLIADTNNGNSAIISYQLDIDDGQGGSFSPVGGYDPLSLITYYSISQGIVRGRTYRLRYRTLNGVGYSGYSPLLYATAANVPSAPASPKLIGATGT